MARVCLAESRNNGGDDNSHDDDNDDDNDDNDDDDDEDYDDDDDDDVYIQAVVVFKAFQEEGQEPDWANLLFWLTVAFPIILMPGWWFYQVCTQSQVSVHCHRQACVLTTRAIYMRACTCIHNHRQMCIVWQSGLSVSVHHALTGKCTRSQVNLYSHNQGYIRACVCIHNHRQMCRVSPSGLSVSVHHAHR